MENVIRATVDDRAVRNVGLNVVACKGLPVEYAVECGHASAEIWAGVLEEFNDVNLCQTWPYSATRWGSRRLAHVVLKREGQVVAAAQVVVMKTPFLPIGLAYVKWGPLWRNEAALSTLLIALKEFFVRQKGLLLRVSPWAFENSAECSALATHGFHRNINSEPVRTLLIDLSHSLDELRASLTRHWRANLRNAEKATLEFDEGTSQNLMDEFVGIYAQMRARKGSEAIPPMDYLPRVQSELPERFKMRVAICRQGGVPSAGLVISAMGVRAFAVAAATGAVGREARGSYLLQWRMIESLKSQNVRWYDLARINEKTHPGTTQFKLGLGGKLGIVQEYLGDFESSGSKATQLLLGAADWFRNHKPAVLNLDFHFRRREAS